MASTKHLTLSRNHHNPRSAVCGDVFESFTQSIQHAQRKTIAPFRLAQGKGCNAHLVGMLFQEFGHGWHLGSAYIRKQSVSGRMLSLSKRLLAHVTTGWFCDIHPERRPSSAEKPG